jgi:hypothetical protein
MKAIDGKSRRSLATVREFPSNLAWSSNDRYLIFSRALETGPELHELRISDGKIRKIPLVAGGFLAGNFPRRNEIGVHGREFPCEYLAQGSA